MNDTIHKSDCNNATTFYQQFPATGHQTTVITLHFTHVYVKTMPRWCRRNGVWKQGVHVKTMPRYRAALYVNTMPQKRHVYTLCIYVETMLWKWHVYTLCIPQYGVACAYIYIAHVYSLRLYRRCRGRTMRIHFVYVKTMPWKRHINASWRRRRKDMSSRRCRGKTIFNVKMVKMMSRIWHVQTPRKRHGKGMHTRWNDALEETIEHPDDVAERKMHVLTSRWCRGRSMFKRQDVTMEGGPQL